MQKLAALEPALAVTGHGDPLAGRELQDALRRLAHNFDELARPVQGRYVVQPAVTGTSGIISLPPLSRRGQVLRAGLLVGAGLLMLRQLRRWGVLGK
ncbi:hypothetical protein [Deinococcus sp. Arct2-2]|uniref:hypothetical protein n=1 Tax=Deinococcus sp. Arct2-2 TaxID=2568653 RepID=UPI001F115E8D|nr:hypothetical protein [Deinococcus sp. Arct2-2]